MNQNWWWCSSVFKFFRHRLQLNEKFNDHFSHFSDILSTVNQVTEKVNLILKAVFLLSPPAEFGCVQLLLGWYSSTNTSHFPPLYMTVYQGMNLNVIVCFRAACQLIKGMSKSLHYWSVSHLLPYKWSPSAVTTCRNDSDTWITETRTDTSGVTSVLIQ